MNYQEYIQREADKANDAQQAERFSEYAAWTVEELEAWTRMMGEPEPETTTERLRRVERQPLFSSLFTPGFYTRFCSPVPDSVA